MAQRAGLGPRWLEALATLLLLGLFRNEMGECVGVGSVEHGGEGGRGRPAVHRGRGYNPFLGHILILGSRTPSFSLPGSWPLPSALASCGGGQPSGEAGGKGASGHLRLPRLPLPLSLSLQEPLGLKVRLAGEVGGGGGATGSDFPGAFECLTLSARPSLSLLLSYLGPPIALGGEDYSPRSSD